MDEVQNNRELIVPRSDKVGQRLRSGGRVRYSSWQNGTSRGINGRLDHGWQSCN